MRKSPQTFNKVSGKTKKYKYNMNKLQQITESKWTYLVIAALIGYVAAYGYENWLPKKD